MKTPEGKKKKDTVVIGPNFLAHWYVYDYEVCSGHQDLQRVMDYINHHGYDIVSVTQNFEGEYTVFFRRRACG